MGNEENRGLIDKKDFEDQLVPFFSSVFELSHFSLSPSHSLTLRFFLEHFGIGERNEKERKEEQDQVDTTRFFVGIDLHIRFPY